MKIFTLLGISLLSMSVNAQSTSTDSVQMKSEDISHQHHEKSKFMLLGYYHSGFEGHLPKSDKGYNFDGGSIAPMLVYKQSDRLFFEAEFEGAYEDGEFSWFLDYADMTYILNDYAMVRSGKFLLPFGTFMEKLQPAWINRFATMPLGFGHGGILPTSDVGIEIRGAFYTGSVKLNYQTYVVNGPQLKIGSEEPDEVGMLTFGYLNDNNADKTIGGRLGVFPFSNSMMEVGFSGLTGKVGATGSIYENVRANLYAVDLSLVKNIDYLMSVVNLKGQYNYSQIGDANYPIADDTTGLLYNFNNVSSTYYGQFSIRPALLDNDFLKKIEFVIRYSELQTPEGARWEQNTTQLGLGLNYWLDWRTVLKIDYQTTKGLRDRESLETFSQDMFYLHWALSF